MSILKDMDELLKNDVVDRHSFFQLRHFLIDSEPTTQGRMWQALRELKTRREALTGITTEIEEQKDQLALIQIRRERISAESLSEAVTPNFGVPVTDREVDFLRREQEIELRQIDRQADARQRQIKGLYERFRHTLDECRFLVEAYRQLEATEKLRPWDDKEVQEQLWNAKLEQEFRRRLVVGQPLDTDLLKAIESLHDHAPVKGHLLALLERVDKASLPNLRSAESLALDPKPEQ